MKGPVTRHLALLLTALLLSACSGDQDPGLQPGDGPGAPRSLDWKRVDAPPGSTITTTRGGSITVDEERTQATVTGAAAVTVMAGDRFTIDEALLDERWAVIVRGDTLEQKPGEATVVDLVTGESAVLDGGSEPPTVNGGTWALHGDTVVHATRGPDGAYCLARRDLTGGVEAAGEVVYCAEDRHGFTNARVTDAGLGLMAFDDGRPSCRTVGVIEGASVVPEPGAVECKGWELLPTRLGAIWSVIPKENELDVAHVYAAPSADGETSEDSEPVRLGEAAAGSLVWCGDAAYFTRDSSRGTPASVLRWRGGAEAEVVYEAKGGKAFIDTPRCGGDRLTISVFADSGDQQLTARVS
jgi:hypothetical protein